MIRRVLAVELYVLLDVSTLSIVRSGKEAKDVSLTIHSDGRLIFVSFSSRSVSPTFSLGSVAQVS